MGWKILAGFLLLIALAVVGLYFYQERVILFPEKLPANFEFQFAERFREQTVELSSGEKINYLVFQPPAARGAILYFHGNAGSLRMWGLVGVELARQTGWEVWMLDYPGYGKSTGALPKTENILFEAGRAVRARMEAESAGRPIVLFGRSIGTGIASALAAESPPLALILETPYRSLGRLGHELFPFLPAAFVRFRLDNEALLPRLSATPVLILHGTADEVIPFAHGKFLGEHNPHARFVEFPNGHHNDLPEQTGYWPAVHDFLTQFIRH